VKILMWACTFVLLAMAATACRDPQLVADSETASAEQRESTTATTGPEPTAASEGESTTTLADPSEDSTTAPAATSQLPPGDHTFDLRHDGRDRRYLVHVPTTVTSPASLVMAFHGGGGNGPDFQKQNGLDAVADREGFVAVYPEGSGVLPKLLHTWNSGDSCCGYALDRQIDDVGFIREVLEVLSERANIDAGRIYMTGHSNGAMMAYRFAAERPDLVTAIAPVGGAVDMAVQTSNHPVAMLHIHSLDDPRALYEGGEGPPFPGTKRTVNHEPTRSGIDQWAERNGCDSEPTEVETIEGSGADAGQSATRLRWSNCDDAATVEHLLLTGSGHGWPGVRVGPILQRLLGPSTTLIDASEEVWAFVSQFTRP